MSNREGETPSAATDVIVAGRLSALQDLTDPPRLSKAELDIIGSYGRLVQLLSGPRSGDERGPAQEPPWVKQGPQLESATLVVEPSQAIFVAGSGLATTTGVWIDGRRSGGWQTLSDRGLAIPIVGEIDDEIDIVVSTPQGDTGARLQLGTDAGDE